MNKTQTNVLCLIAAIVSQATETLIYKDQDGVTSIRRVKVKSIEKCDNGRTVARCFDLDRNAPRCFRLDSVLHVNPLGVLVVG